MGHCRAREQGFFTYTADMKKKREVSYEEGKGYAEKKGMIFIETSAKTGRHVDEAFYSVAKQIIDKINDDK
ncbi:Ras-related protein Rab-2A [Smittium culicis]|uniref:Ras-related protein Rab-2A n=1 Tax=Smittium culicis TaxID=133412 RepID=A0A1R1Y982_9FUNG|nr:Ras-related protein Rab-2A [Smittium culicis]